FRRGRLAYFAKIPARLDDLLNLIPARVAGLSLVAGAVLAGESGGGALAVLRRDRRRTQSPNSGWPMAAMAGALGVALEKPGAHRLRGGGVPLAAGGGPAIRGGALASGGGVAPGG